MEITNKIAVFNFNERTITRRAANTHARPAHQPIYVERDRTDTDIYICSQKYYIEKNIVNITGVSCPRDEKLSLGDFVLKKETFNSYLKRLNYAFEEYGLNEFYKGDLSDIYTIVDDIKIPLILMHTTQQKVRIGFVDGPAKKLILDSLIGDMTQITFNFSSKEVSLSIPIDNLHYLLEEVGKLYLKIKKLKDCKRLRMNLLIFMV